MSEVTKGGDKDRQWLAGVRGQVGKAGGGVFLHHMTIRKLIVLSQECLDRRAAEEGAVTVEGWTDQAALTGDVWLINPECDTVLNVFKSPTGTAVYPALITIRRKP